MKKYAILMLLILMFLSTCLAVVQPDSSKPMPPGQIKKMADREELQGYAQNTIAIQNFSFQPSILSVPAGTTVTWRNQDNVQHTVTSDTVGLFDSNTITPGNVFSFTFNNPGSYKYHCNIHPSMHGEVDITGQAT